jgi:hypothetical protein
VSRIVVVWFVVARIVVVWFVVSRIVVALIGVARTNVVAAVVVVVAGARMFLAYPTKLCCS